MLNAVTRAMASGMTAPDWIRNALLESFVVHLRGLIDFLFNDSPRGDDVVAHDFFTTADTWLSVRPDFSANLQAAKKRAGKEIAHLTYARLAVTPETKPWNFVSISDEVNAAMNAFLSNVSPIKLSDGWKHQANEK
ncbi:MAG: hypothetical protein R3E82_23290 [Pseudomonadales bacterium]